MSSLFAGPVSNFATGFRQTPKKKEKKKKRIPSLCLVRAAVSLLQNTPGESQAVWHSTSIDFILTAIFYLEYGTITRARRKPYEFQN